MKTIKVLLFGLIFICGNYSFSQEVAPEKTFEFSIGINKLKTQIQADKIVSEIQKIRGIENCSLVLIDYKLIFECTNHDMTKNGIIDVVKQIIIEEGSEITTIKRKTIQENEKIK